MKKVSKTIILLTLLIIIAIPNFVSAESYFDKFDEEENTVTDPDLLIPDDVKREREEERQKEQEANQTNYNIITDEDKEKISEFITVKDEYKKFVYVVGVVFLILLIVIIKTNVIEASTKTCIAMFILAVSAYVLQNMVEGKIIPIIDVFVEFLGVILVILANFFIYKHDNLLIYVPIHYVGLFYARNNMTLVSDKPIIQLILLILPIILYVVGGLRQKAKEAAFLIPVKEKHERKDNENEQ